MKKIGILVTIKGIRVCMSIIYTILKIIPTDDKRILFISRQSDNLPIDFKLIEDELRSRDKNLKLKSICCRMDDSYKGIVKFAKAVICSLYYLAVSRVCIIDAYWPSISMLNHKKQLKIIQIWHALGAVKKFGYQTLDKESGRNKFISELMSMHKSYDYVVAGGKAWNKYYSEAFRIEEDKIVNIGLPRIDYLLNNEEKNRTHILDIYPEFAEKPVILYAPTFRRNTKETAIELISKLDTEKYNIVLKNHPNQPISFPQYKIYNCPEFSAMDLLAVCDYLITDYSAIAIEAAVLKRKTLYYLYDYDEYVEKNGLNVDPLKSMPTCSSKDPDEIISIIENNNYNFEEMISFRKKYLPDDLGESTHKLVDIIMYN